MNRKMSFMLTEQQVRDRIKRVTRRVGWNFLKKGDVLDACVKCMGLKKGEKIKVITQIRVVSIRVEQLGAITQEDCALEGFPDFTPDLFVEFFARHMKCKSSQLVNRIEFEYI